MEGKKEYVKKEECSGMANVFEKIKNMPPEERKKKTLLFTGLVFLIFLLLGLIFK